MSIERTYEDLNTTIDALNKEKEISALVTVQSNAAKLLLLGAASEFEVTLCDTVRTYVQEASNSNEHISSFVEAKGISRQYHTWFQWESNNANSFFKMFGSSFTDKMKKKVEEDQNLKNSIKSFLTIGQTRNLLVHKNFTTYNLDHTAEDVYKLYIDAKKFVSGFGLFLRS